MVRSHSVGRKSAPHRTASAEIRSTKAMTFTEEQIIRALSFVDISGDDKVTTSELRGSLLSTSMHATHSNKLAELLLQINPNDVDNDVHNDNDIDADADNDDSFTNGGINISDVRIRLQKLMTGESNNEQGRYLAERAIGHLLKQREDETAAFEWNRAFIGIVVFIFPFVGYTMGKCGYITGPETNNLFIPQTYLDYDRRSQPGWKLKEQKKLLLALRNYTNTGATGTGNQILSNKKATSLSVEFQTTVIIFRLEMVGNDEITTIRFGRTKNTVSELKATGKTTVRTVTIFAESISCENISIQERARDGFPKNSGSSSIGITVRYDSQKQTDTTFDLVIQEAIQQSLKSSLCNPNNNPIAEYVAVWEVRMRCKSKYILSTSFITDESDGENEQDEQEQENTSYGFQRLKGAEIVYQHLPSQTVEFHSAESSSRGHHNMHDPKTYQQQNSTNEQHQQHRQQLIDMEKDEQIQSDIEHIVLWNVRDKSWKRMFRQHILLFFSILFIGILAYIERYVFSHDIYHCNMNYKTNVTCNEINQDEKMYKALVTSAEVVRCLQLYVFMGTFKIIIMKM